MKAGLAARMQITATREQELLSPRVHETLESLLHVPDDAQEGVVCKKYPTMS